MPARRPSEPRATASISGGPGSEVSTTSVASATLRGLSAHVAPAARCGAAASRRMSCTTASKPPFFIMLDAMLAPMIPSPMNPTFMISLLLFCVEDIRCDPRRRHGGGPARVEREVVDELADLFLGAAIGQRALDVALELIAPVHGGEGRDGDKAPVTLGETGALPHVSVEHFLAQVDELGNGATNLVARGC